MLSRVAESLMWMSRYLERANGLARMVEAIEESSLDHNHPIMSNEEAFWAPVYDVLDLQEEKLQFIKENNKEQILYNLLLDRTNLTSVASCIAGARYNARGVRDQIMDEMWETVNDLHLYCKQINPEQLNASEFGAKVRFAIHCFRGLVNASLEQGEAWSFLILGLRLERADQISRLLDLKSFMLSKDRQEVGLLEPYVWHIIAIVSGNKSTGHGMANADWAKMEQFLIFDLVNPTSIRHSVRKTNEVLHNLSGARPGVFTNSAEHVCGKLKADLDYIAFDGLKGIDMHEFLDRIQKELAAVFVEILETYTHTSDSMS